MGDLRDPRRVPRGLSGRRMNSKVLSFVWREAVAVDDRS
jgi:hypothetical protein